jgi:disulfide bond formation protein DsbB
MSPLVSTITVLLSIFTVAGNVIAIFLLATFIFKELKKKHPILHATHRFFRDKGVILAFVVALAGTVSSLFYSVVAGFAPCSLCTWQRIMLYPQVILLGAALWYKNKKLHVYTIILSVAGGILALYNTFLQFGGSSIMPCGASVSCAKRYFLEFGYVTIPTMAFTGFLLIILLLIAIRIEKEPEAKSF